MKTAIDKEFFPTPVVNGEFWVKHVVYSKLRRQGIDIVCASFKHKNPKGNLIFVTGLMESFLKYSEMIQYFYEKGYNVHTYDHQSQGFSGRWLTESQSLWVHAFEDYVDDFVYFVTTISKEDSRLPVYLLAHSMGGFIGACAMSRLPTLINRAVLCAPMLRMKCGMKCFDWRWPLPQTVVYWITYFSCYMGLGSMHALGYFKEKPIDPLSLDLYTSDTNQLKKWYDLRMRYPSLIATCVTNDWVLHSLRAQEKLARSYNLVKTNTLLLSADIDYFVYNRAIMEFMKAAPHAKLFSVPHAYHEILLEREPIRGAVYKVVDDFFSQTSDDASKVRPCHPLEEADINAPTYSFAELLVRGSGLLLAACGCVLGLTMIIGDRRR